MKEWFVIHDLEEFTLKTRALVFNNFGKWSSEPSESNLIDTTTEEDQEEFDSVLSQQESINIVKHIARKQKHKISQETRYVINDKLFADIIHDLNGRMVSNVLNALVQKNIVETAFDSESNDFVFWIKKDETKEKPETD